MSWTSLGDIGQITRYPVKSFIGESMQEIDVESYGLYADRSHAFIDPEKQGYARYFTASQLPELLGYKAVLSKHNHLEHKPYPEVEIMGPDGNPREWNEALLTEIRKHTERPIEMVEYDPAKDELLGVDDSSVLLITDASLRKLEQMWGKELLAQRFRHNLIVNLDEDTPFAELEWIGKKIRIGNCVLQIDKECKRCSKINLDPNNLEQDTSLLQLLGSRNYRFGVYASIVETGTVFVGDPVYLVE